MLRYSLIFGAIAGTIIILLMVLAFAVGGDMAMTEVAGYAIMLVVLSLIFVGIKRYRDLERGGAIGFAAAFGLGVGIAAVAGLFYVATWEAYLALTDNAFVTDYAAKMAAGAEGLPEAERAARLAEVESFEAMYANPLYRLPMTFMEMFPVAVLVALFSALLLKNPKVLPARARG